MQAAQEGCPQPTPPEGGAGQPEGAHRVEPHLGGGGPVGFDLACLDSPVLFPDRYPPVSFGDINRECEMGPSLVMEFR